jgi:hypothetical protein
MSSENPVRPKQVSHLTCRLFLSCSRLRFNGSSSALQCATCRLSHLSIILGVLSGNTKRQSRKQPRLAGHRRLQQVTFPHDQLFCRQLQSKLNPPPWIQVAPVLFPTPLDTEPPRDSARWIPEEHLSPLAGWKLLQPAFSNGKDVVQRWVSWLSSKKPKQGPTCDQRP